MAVRSSRTKISPFVIVLLLLLLILPACKEVAKESSAEREIKQVISSWCNSFKKADYRIQWNLLSSDSPIRKRFEEMERAESVTSGEGAPKPPTAAEVFSMVSGEAFGPLKSYEIYRLKVDERKAKTYLDLHWAGHIGMGESFVRPMRSKLTLELVEEIDRWVVFDEQDGFEDFEISARTGEIVELVGAKEGNVVEVLPNRDGSAIFFVTESGKLGIANMQKHKHTFLPFSLGKEGSLLQAEWSPSGEILGMRYDLPEEPEEFLPTISFFKRNGVQISSVEAAGSFVFTSDESVAWLFGEGGSVEAVEYNFVRGARRVLWDDERSRMEAAVPWKIIGAWGRKVVIEGLPYEGYEWEYSPEIVGTLDTESGEFKRLTDRWRLSIPEAAYALKGQKLAFLGGRAKVEEGTGREIWEEISLVVVDLVSRKEKVIRFMGEVPVSDMEVVEHFSWSPRGDEIAFVYGTKGLFLASVKDGEFQGIYPRGMDWENSRTSGEPGTAEIWSVRWAPSSDRILFVASPGKVFLSFRSQAWEPVEIEELSKRVDGAQCYWLSHQEITWVGWRKAGEKEKPRAEAAPKEIHAVDVSLK